jgi:hypothetical protein
MPKIQLGPAGNYAVTVPKDIVEGKQWGKGDELGFAIVDNQTVFAAPGDIVLKLNRKGGNSARVS